MLFFAPARGHKFSLMFGLKCPKSPKGAGNLLK